MSTGDVGSTSRDDAQTAASGSAANAGALRSALWQSARLEPGFSGTKGGDEEMNPWKRELAARTLSRSGSISGGNDAADNAGPDRASSGASAEVPTWKRELAKRQSALIRRSSKPEIVPLPSLSPPETNPDVDARLRRSSASAVPTSSDGANVPAEELPLPEGWKLHKPADGGRYVPFACLGPSCCCYCFWVCWQALLLPQGNKGHSVAASISAAE